LRITADGRRNLPRAGAFAPFGAARLDSHARHVAEPKRLGRSVAFDQHGIRGYAEFGKVDLRRDAEQRQIRDVDDRRRFQRRADPLGGTLKLELTESVVMENPEHAAQMLHRIRELGAGLALDDFGTGYSSLSYLQRFPFDTIKIDQSFVRTTAKGTRPVILRSIIALAHDLGMDVVAEGAETDSDAVELSQLGCEYAQGFVFGAPMTPEKALELLQREHAMELAR